MGHTTRSLFLGPFIFDYELFVLRFKVFDYPFDMFKLFFQDQEIQIAL